MKNMILGCVAVLAMMTGTAQGAVVINEFLADDAGGDTEEFVELFGTPGESLNAISLIVVDGDTDGSTTATQYRRVTVQFDFTSEVIPSDGFFFARLAIGCGSQFFY